MEEQEKPRFKVDEPVYLVSTIDNTTKEKRLTKGYISFIQKVHGCRNGLKGEGGGPYVYYLYAFDYVSESGVSNPQYAEEFFQERYVGK